MRSLMCYLVIIMSDNDTKAIDPDLHLPTHG